jgi:hypothetical protein
MKHHNPLSYTWEIIWNGWVAQNNCIFAPQVSLLFLFCILFGKVVVA